ncbi:hypothetical protein PSENEW3_00001053 [Picochlorum sp. SENEW3]|nr:hypothetical protein PSENEW3_00001053 [Picochlorum sp. SENEW3]
MGYRRYTSIVVALVLLVTCQGAPSAEQAPGPEPESAWCVEKRGMCAAGCQQFGKELSRVSFECSDSIRSMVQASTCVCLGAEDRVLSSSSDSRATGVGGASAASSSFSSSASSSSSTSSDSSDFVL